MRLPNTGKEESFDFLTAQQAVATDIRSRYTQREVCISGWVASHQREQEERAQVGVHDKGVLLAGIVQAGLANVGPDVIDEDVQQTVEALVRLATTRIQHEHQATISNLVSLMIQIDVSRRMATRARGLVDESLEM